MRNRLFAYAKTKMQISFLVTGKLISAFVFATRIVQSLYLIRNFKPVSIVCGCTAPFVWDLVGNPEDGFSHNEAHIYAANNKVLIKLDGCAGGSPSLLFALHKTGFLMTCFILIFFQVDSGSTMPKANKQVNYRFEHKVKYMYHTFTIMAREKAIILSRQRFCTVPTRSTAQIVILALLPCSCRQGRLRPLFFIYFLFYRFFFSQQVRIGG